MFNANKTLRKRWIFHLVFWPNPQFPGKLKTLLENFIFCAMKRDISQYLSKYTMIQRFWNIPGEVLFQLSCVIAYIVRHLLGTSQASMMKFFLRK